MTCEEWPILWPKNVVPDLPPVIIDAAKAAAQSFIWSHTGRRLGACEVTEVYALTQGCDRLVCPMPGSHGWPTGLLAYSPTGLLLEHSPVTAVAEVQLDGTPLSAGLWSVSSDMIWLRGQAWPTGSTVTVTYTYGLLINGSPLEGLVALAMGEAALDFCQPSLGGKCKLLARPSSINRQGVGKTFDKTADETGLHMVDALIAAVNPSKLKARPMLFSPDLPERVG